MVDEDRKKHFFKFHWNEDKHIITVICKHEYCMFHSSDSISDCNCGHALVDAIDNRGMRIRMFKGLDDMGKVIKKSKLKDERKECFLYQENITEQW